MGGSSRLPLLGPATHRGRLLEAILRSAEPLVVLAAPGGFGKTVLAAQVATEGFGEVYWIDCAGLMGGREQILTQLRNAIGDPTECTGAERQILMPGADGADLLMQIEEALTRRARQSFAVVFDAIPPGGDFSTIADVARKVSVVSGGHARVLVTTRWESTEVVAQLPQSFAISADALRLNEAENREVVLLYCDSETSDEVSSAILAASDGRVATACVLARQHAIGPDGAALSSRPSLDLRHHLLSLAHSQMDSRALRSLCGAALLRHGSPDSLARVVGWECATDMGLLSELMPLLAVGDGAGDEWFRMHDLAAAVFEDETFAALSAADAAQLVVGALGELDGLSRHDELFALAARRADPDVIESWLINRGDRLLDTGSLELLDRCMSRLGPGRVLRRPALLLLQAEMLRERMTFDEALRKALVARDLAVHECDPEVSTSAQLAAARLQMDLGLMASAAQSLADAVSTGELGSDATALAHSYMGVCYACTGELRLAKRHAAIASRCVRAGLSPAVEGRVRTGAAAILGVLAGRWDQVLLLCLGVREIRGLPFGLRMQTEGNLGAVYVELGHLDRAEALLGATIAACSDQGHRMLELSFMDSSACARAGQGRYDEANELMRTAVAGFMEVGDAMEMARGLVCQSAWTRAQDRPLEAIPLAEQALEICSSITCDWLAWTATLEIAAGMLRMGDRIAARRQTNSIRGRAVAADAAAHVLMCDTVLAEVDRAEGNYQAAIARLIEHEEYIRTDSANWQLGMYIRAFPHLLGLLAQAMGADSLSPYLLRMVLPQDRMGALRASREVMDAEEWGRLAVRLVGEKGLERLNQPPGTPICRVRLFGGLEVSIGDRVVRDKQWRKRKSRLLFAMLVVNRGKDVPRDQLFDYLWPDMDAERARNNLYVIWSAMKSALLDDAAKNTPFPYAENTGGVCRVVRALVDSDLDEFDASIALAEEAESEDNPLGAIRAYERLAEVYRGELLPGDVYDDWFSGIRDRYRIEFGDAMLKAATILESRGEHAKAQKMARRGLQADSWREDLYQAALRAQISGGQRSAAIETYLACRSRLADDLGLDPSGETLRLYEQVLAMEDASEADASAFDEPLV